MTASGIYSGSIRHRRFADRENSFRHGLSLAYIDLDELPSLIGGRLVRSSAGLVRFRRSDYLGDPSVDLKTAVLDLVEAREGVRPDGPVRLLTQLRSFGHCFNPVSFYYCFAADGTRVEAVVAEVTNTPWGERHAYTLTRSPEAESGAVVRGESEKVLHVSPFMSMDQRYSWNVAAPRDTLSVHIENHRAGELAFDATLAMKRQPFSKRTLRRATLRYPAATARVVALIYGHALGLKLKGLRVYPHPAEGSTS